MTPEVGGLCKFLRGVKSRKRTPSSSFVVFNDQEERELERITSLLVRDQYHYGSWDEVVRFLRLILQPLPFAIARLMSPFPCKEINGEPASFKRRVIMAIEIK